MSSRSRSCHARWPALALAALAGCAVDDVGLKSADAGVDAGSEPPVADHCNPLDPQECLLPWPSSVYLEEDDDAATGVGVAIPEAAMPANRHGVAPDTAPYARRDGFPASGVMLASFSTGVSPEGLPPHWDIGASLADDAPIVLLDMETGERQPFFAEVDANPFNSEPLRALIIRPVERLAPATRYAVAIRDRVRGAHGEPLPTSAAFRAIRDGDTPEHPRARDVASSYEAIFAALQDAGVEREEVVLAWDFVTASDASLTSDLHTMRDQAVEALEAGEALEYDVEEEIDPDSPHVLRLVRGTFEAPNFLTDGEKSESVIVRDGDELPVRDGTYDANLTAIVPACVQEADLPVPVLVFGHGIFGSAQEYLALSRLRRFADEECRVVLGTDWIGLTDRQATVAAQAAGDIGRLPWVGEKLAQGVINFIALGYLARGPLAESSLFQIGGASILDEADVSYFGISLGGIMGGVLMAYDPEIERAALGVPGGSWGLMLERSYAWNVFQGPLINAYGDQLTYQVAIALMNMLFEAYDPLTTAGRVLSDPLEGTPPKQLFLYQAMGDSVVSNLATGMLARTMELPVTTPAVHVPYGLEVTEDALPSALTIYDQAFEPLPPDDNSPPAEDNGTHAGVNYLDAVFRQLGGFFADGVVRQECYLDGEPAPCDCTTGACD